MCSYIFYTNSKNKAFDIFGNSNEKVNGNKPWYEISLDTENDKNNNDFFKLDPQILERTNRETYKEIKLSENMNQAEKESYISKCNTDIIKKGSWQYDALIAIDKAREQLSNMSEGYSFGGMLLSQKPTDKKIPHVDDDVADVAGIGKNGDISAGAINISKSKDWNYANNKWNINLYSAEGNASLVVGKDSKTGEYGVKVGGEALVSVISADETLTLKSGKINVSLGLSGYAGGVGGKAEFSLTNKGIKAGVGASLGVGGGLTVGSII